jgi:hypothetical protein
VGGRGIALDRGPRTGRCLAHCGASVGYLWVTPPDETSQLGGRWLGGLVCQHGEIDAPAHAARAARHSDDQSYPAEVPGGTGACPAPLRGVDGGAGWAAGPVRHLCGGWTGVPVGRPLRRSACQMTGDERDSPAPFGELATGQEGRAL